MYASLRQRMLGSPRSFVHPMTFAGAILLVITPAALAQPILVNAPVSPTDVVVIRGMIISPEIMRQLAAANASDVKASSGEEVPSPLLNALLQLTFNRSPDAMLAEWSRRRLPEKEPGRERPITSGDTAPAVPPTREVPSLAQLPENLPAEVRAQIMAQMGGAGAPTPPANAPEEARKAHEASEQAQQFGRMVTAGDWDDVGKFLLSLPANDAKKVYEHVLTGLTTPPQEGADQPISSAVMRRNAIAMGRAIAVSGMEMRSMQAHQGFVPTVQVLSPVDLIGLFTSAPRTPSSEQIGKLAALVSIVRANGHVLDPIVDALRQGIRNVGGDTPPGRERAARFWLTARQLEHAREFLPSWEDPSVRTREVAVSLLADYYHDRYQADQRPRDLARVWEIHQQLLSLDDLKPVTRKLTLSRLVEYASLVDKERGQEWLEQSFTLDLERGCRLLTIFGSEVAVNVQQRIHDPAGRLARLRLQNLAAEALVHTAPSTAEEWQATLTRLAENWLREAALTQQYTRDPSQQTIMQWDNFGNMYYLNADQDPYVRMEQPNQPKPIPIRDLLDCRPSPDWLEKVDVSLRPRFAVLSAQLLLKTNDEREAFTALQDVAPTDPKAARDLVHQFLQCWKRNHDPNSMRRMYNPYVYIYGYNQQAEAIPLTRSKQQRNLSELKEWVAKIRALPIQAIDESYLADAFTTCHSSAEVYRLEAFEEVFGRIDSLKPETTASIVETMRINLASIWRKVKTQEEAKTKRKEKDIQQAVLQGYDVAIAVIEQAQDKHTDHWELQLALAALHFDRNAYEQSIRKSSEFVACRAAAFDQFAHAAELYAQAVPRLTKEKQSTRVFDTWFYASLGASDLNVVSHENVPDPKQYPRIREALLSLGNAAGDHHLGEFAHQLFERLKSVQPQAKFRYIRGGFAIVQDHPRAREARESLQYYTDVVDELRLATRMDGSDQVKAGEPFGLFVTFLHTTEMERESGGFEKYVQNQNSAAFYYNFGRPPENYRDKFQDAAVGQLEEHFDVVSVTFENPKVMRSRKTERDGWRETPYAYLLLKAKGPEVDRIPKLHLDLDFFDSTGYVVIPIESSPIPIDATATNPLPRPMENLEIVQTLDERQARDGKLILDIKATARGLVPSLDQIVDLAMDGFDVRIEEDQGSVPSEFDSESEAIQVKSDRSWLVELTAKPGEGMNRDFSFATSRSAETKMGYLRYDDADMVAAEPRVVLGHTYGRARWPVSWYAAAAAIVALGLISLVLGIRTLRPTPTASPRYQVPREINPFTVIGLLDRMQQDELISVAERAEVQRSIDHLQRHYFSPHNGESPPDLQQVATQWVQRVAPITR